MNSNYSPRQEAINILNQYWDEKIPVDLVNIAKAMGVSVVERNLSPNTAGVIYYDGDLVNIDININNNLVRKRFTLAHELGHLQLGHLQNCNPKFRVDDNHFYSNEENCDERDANNFAIELLIPEEAIKLLVRKKSVTSIDELSSYFLASKLAVGYRIQNLGLAE